MFEISKKIARIHDTKSETIGKGLPYKWDGGISCITPGQLMPPCYDAMVASRSVGSRSILWPRIEGKGREGRPQRVGIPQCCDFLDARRIRHVELISIFYYTRVCYYP